MHLIKTNRFLIEQSRKQAFNTDTILLSNFININKNINNILEIGTGAGFIMLYLASKTKANIYGVEIQENRFLQALKNIKMNGLEKQLKVYNEDIKEFNQDFKFDMIVSNPPFFKINDEKRLSKDNEDLIARHEIALNLEELFINAKRLLKYRGHFYFIHRPDRLEEIISYAAKYNFRIKRIRFIHPYIDENANHVLIEAIKDGNYSTIVLNPLILYKDKHIFTDEMKEIIGDF